MRKYHFLIALSVLALDRLTKWTIARRLSLHDGIQVIPGFFRIIHAENPGAAFGIFADSPSPWKVGLLILFSVIALLIVSALLWKSSHTMTTTGVGRRVDRKPCRLRPSLNLTGRPLFIQTGLWSKPIEP